MLVQEPHSVSLEKIAVSRFFVCILSMILSSLGVTNEIVTCLYISIGDTSFSI